MVTNGGARRECACSESERVSGGGAGAGTREYANMCMFSHNAEFVILKALVSIFMSYFIIPSSYTRYVFHLN